MPTHYQGSKTDRAALNAYINLVRASETILSRLGAKLEASGLTLGQFGVLEALLHLGPMSQRELGEKLLRSGGNVTLVVDNLERHGWVHRVRQESDRRKMWVQLTATGRRLIKRALPLHVRGIVEEFRPLDAKQQQTLRELCRKLGRGSPAQGLRNRENREERINDRTATE